MKTTLNIVGVICAVIGLLSLVLYVPYLVTGRDLGGFGTCVGVVFLGAGAACLWAGNKKENLDEWKGSEW